MLRVDKSACFFDLTLYPIKIMKDDISKKACFYGPFANYHYKKNCVIFHNICDNNNKEELEWLNDILEAADYKIQSEK